MRNSTALYSYGRTQQSVDHTCKTQKGVKIPDSANDHLRGVKMHVWTDRFQAKNKTEGSLSFKTASRFLWINYSEIRA